MAETKRLGRAECPVGPLGAYNGGMAEDIDIPGIVTDEHLARALRGEDALVFDGAMGTQLMARGFAREAAPFELLSLTHPAAVTAIHAAYVAAGADVATTNTFGANRRALEGRASVADVYRAAVSCAREAGARYVAGDIGPLGALFDPAGPLAYEEAYDLFAEQVDAVRAAGCDLVLIETMLDLGETQAALRAARERCDLPVLVTMTLAADGRTYLGTPPEMAAVALASLGAHAVGFNCSFGPDLMADAVRATARRVACPLLVQPNAGLPREGADGLVYELGPDAFARAMEPLMAAGATMVGGCCGTGPAHIERLSALAAGKTS